MATKHTDTLRDLLVANTSIPADHIKNTPYGAHDEDRVVGQWPQGDLGPPEQFFHGSESERKKSIQIRVRGPRNDFNQAYQDAREVEDALDYQEPQGYLAVKHLNGPSYIGKDDDGRHEFSHNVLCWIIE